MKKVTSEVIQFRGSHYAFGLKQAEALMGSALFQNREALYLRLKRKFVVDVPQVKALLTNYAPSIIEEIQGLADGLQLTEQQAYLHFGGYYAAYPKSGCSIITGQDYMIRNYDNDPFSYDGRYVFYAPTDEGYATMGPTMQVTGRMDGMNEKGLVVGYNFVNTKNSEDGFVCNMIGRIVLESCANVSEAVSLLKELPHKHSFNYVLLDSSHEALAVEASPRRVEIRSTAACTNHFHILKEENRYRMEDSKAREDVIMTAQSHTLGLKEAFQLMNSSDNGVFATKYGAWDGTLHTAGYLPEQLKSLFVLGGDALPLVIDFNNWLQGTDFTFTKIKGSLAANSGFANEISM